MSADIQLKVRLTAEENERLIAHVAASGMATKTDYIKACVFGDVPHVIKSGTQGTQALSELSTLVREQQDTIAMMVKEQVALREELMRLAREVHDVVHNAVKDAVHPPSLFKSGKVQQQQQPNGKRR